MTPGTHGGEALEASALYGKASPVDAPACVSGSYAESSTGYQKTWTAC